MKTMGKEEPTRNKNVGLPPSFVIPPTPFRETVGSSPSDSTYHRLLTEEHKKTLFWRLPPEEQKKLKEWIQEGYEWE